MPLSLVHLPPPSPTVCHSSPRSWWQVLTGIQCKISLWDVFHLANKVSLTRCKLAMPTTKTPPMCRMQSKYTQWHTWRLPIWPWWSPQPHILSHGASRFMFIRSGIAPAQEHVGLQFGNLALNIWCLTPASSRGSADEVLLGIIWVRRNRDDLFVLGYFRHKTEAHIIQRIWYFVVLRFA